MERLVMASVRWRIPARYLLLFLGSYVLILVHAVPQLHGAFTWELQSTQSSWKQVEFALVALGDDTALMLGGCTGEISSCPENQVWKGSNYGAKWELVQATNAPPGRYHAEALRAGKNVVLLGGWTGNQAKDDVWISDDAGRTWKQTLAGSGERPPARYHFGAAVLSHLHLHDASSHTHEGTAESNRYEIVLLGGMSPAAGRLNDVWLSGDYGSTWKQMKAAPGESAERWVARSRFGVAVVKDDATEDDILLVLGGRTVSDETGADVNFNDVWSSRNKGATWTLEGTAGWSPRSMFGCGVLSDNSIIVLGGSAGGTLYNDVWRGMEVGRDWALVPDPSPWLARSVHAFAVLESDRLIIVGGSDQSENGYSTDVWTSTPVFTTTFTTTNITSTTTTTSTTTNTTTTTTTTSATTSMLIAPLMAGHLFKHVKFSPMSTRSPNAGAVQLGGVAFRSRGIVLDISGTVATNPLGNSRSWRPSYAIDGKVNTKWLDSRKGALIITFEKPTHIDRFMFTTAMDRPDYDPCSWRLDGSLDYVTWTPLHVHVDTVCRTPTARSTQTPWFHIRQVTENFGFEEGSKTLTYEYKSTVPSWSVAGQVVFVHSGDATWCSTFAAEDSYFLGLKGGQSAISKSVPRHVPGNAYILHFQIAKCQDNPTPTLRVVIDDKEMMSFIPDSTAFSRAKIYYVALSIDIKIEFKNAGTGDPKYDADVDDEHQNVVFIDQIMIVQTARTTTTSTTTTTTTTTTPDETDIAWVLGGAACGVGAVGAIACFFTGYKAYRGESAFSCCRKSTENSKVAVFDELF